jgi:hypothetical protein
MIVCMDNELKHCGTCKEYKERDLFTNNKSKKDGKDYRCKSCRSAYNCAYYKKNEERMNARNLSWQKAHAEKVQAMNRAWHKANREKSILNRTRQRANKLNLEFNLELEDIHIPTHCPILGILLEKGNTNKNRDSSPSLDRILPAKGYVKGNVQVISDLANRMKSNATFAQMVLMGKWAERFTETS